MSKSKCRLSLSAACMAAAFFLFFQPLAARAQRLPSTVKPERYILRLTPDLQKATFSGSETIDVSVEQPVDSITLNAAEIHFVRVTATLGGKAVVAKVTEDADKQQATFDFGQQLPAGKLTLDIRYTGILNNELRGFYLSKTAKRNYAVTQFESTDARRAFPSFDEPAYKAKFSVTVVVDKGDTAISNTNIVEDKPMPGTNGDKHAITFAETPKMSTYLVAFLVGDFQCLSGSSDEVPIRVCATPGQMQYGKFALAATEYDLHYYDTYFGIKYPMPKLDMIALPDFEAGAMENFGAITYRETDLLVDSDHASVAAQRRVALVVAHEMAHQWFGDMVTMQWWDNTWLNEGFATWMENKAVDAWKPEFRMSQEAALDNQGTLNLDAQKITRTIRAKADTPDEINEMFDGISYGKAGAMLLMVENYVGEETFRKGVHDYLAAHLYGNATAEDFWSAQTAVSHKPVDKIMESLVVEPGVPLLTLGAQEAGAVPVSQQRFFLDPKSGTGAEMWTLPVCFKLSNASSCDVLSASHQALPLPTGASLFANAEGKGYYRTSYPDSTLQGIVGGAETELSPEERISLIGDQWALMRGGKGRLNSFLDVVKAMKGDSSPEIVASIIADLSSIDARIAGNPEERERFAGWVREQFGESYARLGEPAASDTAETRELRADLLSLSAVLGHDPKAIAEAKKLAQQSLAGPGSVDPTLSDAAIKIAAMYGDAAFFDQLEKVSEDAPNPQQRNLALRSLELFRDPALEQRALDYAVSGKVKNQDATGFVAAELYNRDTSDFAWQYIEDHWDKVNAQFTTFGGAYIVQAAGGFCSVEKLNQVTSFFAAHKVAASERTLAKSKDAINDCIDLRAAQEANLNAWLAQQGS